MALPTLLDLVFRWLGSARYNATPPSGGDGQLSEHQCDDKGYLRTTDEVVATYDPPTALLASDVVETSPTRLVEAHVINTSGDDRYFQIFDGTSVPADGVAPKYAALVPAGGSIALSFRARFELSSGLCWASSTTLATKTITGTPDLWVSLWTV